MICCCNEDGVACTREGAVYRVTAQQMYVAVNAPGACPKLSYDLERSRVVCDYHVFNVVKTNLNQERAAKILSRRDFIAAILGSEEPVVKRRKTVKKDVLTENKPPRWTSLLPSATL